MGIYSKLILKLRYKTILGTLSYKGRTPDNIDTYERMAVLPFREKYYRQPTCTDYHQDRGEIGK